MTRRSTYLIRRVLDDLRIVRTPQPSPLSLKGTSLPLPSGHSLSEQETLSCWNFLASPPCLLDQSQPTGAVPAVGYSPGHTFNSPSQSVLPAGGFPARAPARAHSTTQRINHANRVQTPYNRGARSSNEGPLRAIPAILNLVAIPPQPVFFNIPPNFVSYPY